MYMKQGFLIFPTLSRICFVLFKMVAVIAFGNYVALNDFFL